MGRSLPKYFFALALICCLQLILNPTKSSAQNEQTDTTSYKSSTIVLPAISSSPETSLLFGGVLIRQFTLGSDYEHTRSSTALIAAVYTLNNQISLGFFPSLFTPNEKWVIEGAYDYNYFPESYWGIGPNTKDEDEVKVIYRQFSIQQALLRKVQPGVFIGPQIQWSNTYDLRFENLEGETMPAPAVNGSSDYHNFGAGMMIRLDDRNRSSTPTRGKYVQFSLMTNPSWLGKNDSYTNYQVDARKFLDLSNGGQSVLAFQGLLQLGTGNPPFKDMAILGGESIMRGYYSGRYRDQNGAQFQSEFRQHLLGRLGFTVFGATGKVWQSFDNLALDQTLWSAGAGLRFNLSKQDPLNLRMDMAFGQNTTGFYFTLGEAF